MKREFALIKMDAPVVKGMAGAIFMACVTGLATHLRITLPFTPVPITFQVFAVLLSGALLGPRFGALSQVLYVAAGAAGVPWFTGNILGPTGGYLIGFIPAAFIAGTSLNAYLKMIFSVLVIYLFGAAQFSSVIGTDALTTFKMAVVPFIGLDILKGLLVSLTLEAILRR